jgi:hypothetical protein
VGVEADGQTRIEFEVPDGEIVVAVDRSSVGWMVTTIRYATGEEE